MAWVGLSLFVFLGDRRAVARFQVSLSQTFGLDDTIHTQMLLDEWMHGKRSRWCVVDLVDPSVETTPEQARCCLRKVRQSMPLGVAGKDKPWMWSHGFSKYFVPYVPDEPLPRHGTCAVLSNAPSMREVGPKYLDEINSADAVFRINKAVVKGFEHIVGHKKTYRVLNIHDGVIDTPEIMSTLESGDGTLFIREEMYNHPFEGNVSRFWEYKRNSMRKGPLRRYQTMTIPFPKSKVYFNHPVFAEFSVDRLHRGIIGSTSTPLSTGSQAIVLALMMCDKVVSYEIASESPLSRYHKYYYEDPNVTRSYKWWHPLSTEVAFQQFFATSRRPNSSIYEYDMTSDKC